MKRYFGCHVSAAGGLANAIVNGSALGANAIQIHPSPPQRWNAKPFPAGVEDEFLRLKAASGIEKVFFHGVYLINLATPDPQKFKLSQLSLLHYLDLCARTASDGVIFHVGSNKDQPTEEEGLNQAVQAINKLLDENRTAARLLLEVAAGSGKIIGDRLEELAAIYSAVQDQSRVGFALDSQHLWASGYDLAGRLDEVVGEVEAVFGIDKVWAIHLNDSKSALGSRIDRHANLGEGLIGLPALERFVNHPRLRRIPFILETPGLKDSETAAEEVRKLREVIAD